MEAIVGDCREVLSDRFEANWFYSVVCDPPYGLEFMGKEWDHGVPGREFWIEVKRVLKPGGFLLAFGGTRTSHRLTCAIEDAGFEIRDSISWIYGSGFPKSLDISKGIDGKVGAVREGRNYIPNDLNKVFEKNKGGGQTQYTTASTALAQEWDGWGTGLKPSHEPIIVARKPLSEKTVVDNVLRHRTGGINVDGGRINLYENNEPNMRMNATNHKRNYSNPSSFGLHTSTEAELINADLGRHNSKGRWPANVILGHLEGCKVIGTKEGKPIQVSAGDSIRRKAINFSKTVLYKLGTGWKTRTGGKVEVWQCVDGCPVKELDGQGIERGVRSAGSATSGRDCTKKQGGVGFGNFNGKGFRLGDAGNVSRFFYQAKASNNERYFPCKTCDRVDNNTEIHEDHEITFHPTQKPLQLLRYLVRLVTPIEGLVLDPFMGTGTTILAAKLEGFDGIGIDKEPDYVRIANFRLGKTNQEPLKRSVYHDKPKVTISLGGKELITTEAF